MQLIPYIIIGCWAAFILVWFTFAFNVKRDIGRSPWRRLWWLRIIIVVTVISVISATSSFSKVMHNFWITQWLIQTPLYGPLGIVAAVFCVVGIGIAIWARVYLGRNWSGIPSLKQGHELVTSGPYAYVRHPIYTGIILAILGSAITSPVWLITFFVVSAMFIWRVYVEEGLMIQQFPTQYPEYQKKTWALVPWVW
jgi:protein-S-isoprenylcysteine O-methyltransferase Ste14